LTVIANFVAMTQGQPPAWATYSPLLPLALLLFTGLYLFMVLYATKWAQRATHRRQLTMNAEGHNGRQVDEEVRGDEERREEEDREEAVVEGWKWMGTPVWSHEGMYALANAHKDKVKLTFHHGAQLPDPDKLFNAMLEGNKWRAIDFREGDRIEKTALGALLREAVAYNTTHSVPKSKGSRVQARA
jgi:hypothetical protein